MGDLEKQEMAAMGPRVEEEKERLLDGMAVVDFDVLCNTVALQTQQGKWRKLDGIGIGGDEDGEGNDVGGVLRMWEGELLDVFDNRRIALESACCPCYRFGKNMRRAGLGYCFLQGTVYFVLVSSALLNFIAFMVTRSKCFLYLAAAFTISLAAYSGFFRTQMRKKFNIRGSDSTMDDCFFHLVSPFCILSQESRTLEMNNVQDGTWHGRGDTICIGSFPEGIKAFCELQQPPIVSVVPSENCS